MRMLRMVVLLGVTGSLAGFTWAAAPPSKVAHGEVRLKTGVVAQYDYHFNRNAIRDSILVDEALIVLTDSYNLLRLDLKTLRPTCEQYQTRGIACIGRGEAGLILAGLEDGRICRVDTKTLELTELAKVPGFPTWVGASGAPGSKQPGIVAVIDNETVCDLASGKTFELEIPVTTYFLDKKRGLWIGGNNTCSKLDLSSGVLTTVEGLIEKEFEKVPMWYAINGFLEQKNGKILAFGGSLGFGNMGMGDSLVFIRRIDGRKVERLFYTDEMTRFRVSQTQQAKKSSGEGPFPRQSIIRIFEEKDGSFLVLTSNQIYRADAAFKKWKSGENIDGDRGPDIGLPHLIGKPNPGSLHIRSAHLIKESGDELICDTYTQGFVRIRGGKVERHMIPGQLGELAIQSFGTSGEGVLLAGVESDFAMESKEALWRLQAGQWTQLKPTPPYQLDPKDEKDHSFNVRDWDEVRVFLGPTGTVTTVCGSSSHPGTRVAARQNRRRIEILGREFSKIDLSYVFMTPDENLWATDADNLSQFVQGQWQVVSELPRTPVDEPEVKPSQVGEFPVRGNGLLNVGKNIKTVGMTGPPWILLDEDNTHLLRLEQPSGQGKPKLSYLQIRERGMPIQVHDALMESNGELLLATEVGLRLYDIKQRRLRTFKGPSLPEDALMTRLCRDGLGRLWVGGDAGLWMIDDANVAHDFSALPMIDTLGTVVILAKDPRRNDGVIVSLGVRDLLFLKATKASTR